MKRLKHMGTPIATGLIFLVCASLITVPVRLDAARLDGAAAPDSFVWEDPEEVAAMLAELDEDGALLTTEDWRRLGLDPEGGPARISAPVDGVTGYRIRWREYRRSDGRSTPLAKARYETRNWRGVLRWTPGTTAADSHAGSLWRRGRKLQAVAGGVGLHHGLGLLCAGPGRWRTLSATQSLCTSSEGLRSWAGAPDATGVYGVGAGIGNSVGRVDFMEGNLQCPGAEMVASGVRTGRIESGLGQCRGSFLAGKFGDCRGGSAAVSWQGEGARLQAEQAVWNHNEGAPAQRAWALSGRLFDPRWLVEGMVASSEASDGAPLARRVASLGGWDGSGCVLRGRWKPGTSLTLRMLAYVGQYRRQSGGESLLRKESRLELALSCRCGESDRIQLRHRISGYRDTGWGDRPLWLGPAVLALRHDEQTVLSWSGVAGNCRLWASARSLLRVQLDDEKQSRLRRTLLSGRFVWDEGSWIGQWRLRGSTPWAWGDDIDNVSAAIPLSGVMLPRHWGKWIGGTSAAVEKDLGLWRFQIGGSARFPARDAESGTMLELFICLAGGHG